MSSLAVKPKAKFVVVTGGVLSGLGKGIAAASIGNLISSRLKVVPIKCEGYLNVDPGTMNPTEHGEVFVLDDGEEADMDFGHYERFIGISCKSHWNITMGKVFREIRKKERRGDYLGKTVQFVPHVTDLIKGMFFRIAEEEGADIVIVEIGGTVGDIETELHIEAARQLKRDLGEQNVLYIHLTYVPIPFSVNEQKSKPTQQSVNLLRERGITPDIIIGRGPEMLTDEIKEKISIFCDVDKDAVISGVDVNNVYKIPIVFEQEGIAEIVHKKLNIYSPPALGRWKRLVKNMETADKEVTIAICGKYTKLEDSYVSIVEALKHSGAHLNCKIKLKWIETSKVQDIPASLKGVGGVIVPGGFGSRGTEGKIEVIRCCRENSIPFLGICYGMQLAVVEFARNVCGLKGAHSTEIDERTNHPVIDILPEQKAITDKGGTMRLGAYEAEIKQGTKVYELYGSEKVFERHRHRYEVSPQYHQILLEQGMVFSGMSPDGKLVEFIELPNHKYFVATQAHPELKSSLIKSAPLFYGLVRAALDQK